MQTDSLITPFEPQFFKEELSLENWDAIDAIFKDLLSKDIDSEKDLMDWFKINDELDQILGEKINWIYINMSRDTANETYKKQFQHLNAEVIPKLHKIENEINQKLAKSEAFKNLDLEEFQNFKKKLYFKLEIYSDKNLDLFVKESELSVKYQELQSRQKVTLDGEEKTINQALKVLESTDRTKRKSDFAVVQDERLKNSDKLDEIMTDLIQLRHEIAKNAGEENYGTYKFKQLGRTSYDKKDCIAFHSAIENEVKPLLVEIQENRKKQLGYDALKPYDLAVDPKNRAELVPFKGSRELIDKTIEVLSRTHTPFGQYLKKMDEMGYLDLESRMNKAPGGFNCPLPVSKVPFIFMNAADAMRDAEILLHEAGHATHNFCMNDLGLNMFREIPSEVAELASMTMENITKDHWDVYFDNEEDLKRAQLSHLEGSIKSLCWIALIDKFQFWMYENPTHSVEERKAEWVTLYSRFMGDVVDYSDRPETLHYLWQKQLHIFEVPFYYIEYGFAQLGAFAVWKNYRADKAKAQADYINGLSHGYTKTIGGIYKEAGIEFKFDSDYVQNIIGFVKEELVALN